MPDIKIFNPAELSKPRSPYMQVARVKTSEFAFIAGRCLSTRPDALSGLVTSMRNVRRSSPIFTRRYVRSEQNGGTS